MHNQSQQRKNKSVLLVSSQNKDAQPQLYSTRCLNLNTDCRLEPLKAHVKDSCLCSTKTKMKGRLLLMPFWEWGIHTHSDDTLNYHARPYLRLGKFMSQNAPSDTLVISHICYRICFLSRWTTKKDRGNCEYNQEDRICFVSGLWAVDS